MGAGNSFCQNQMASYVILADPVSRMPPAPNAPLSDWEQQVITRWVNNGGRQ